MATVLALLRDTLMLYDDAADPVSGADIGDFTATAQLDESSLTVSAVVTMSEVGDGEYAASFTPTRLGRWTIEIAYDDGTISRLFRKSYSVTPQPFVGLSSGRPIRR